MNYPLARLPRAALTPEQEAQLRYGCVICRKQAELHHLRCDGSMGKKGDRTIPLCPWHHRNGPNAFHRGPGIFQYGYGTEEVLYARVMFELSRGGEGG